MTKLQMAGVGMFFNAGKTVRWISSAAGMRIGMGSVTSLVNSGWETKRSTRFFSCTTCMSYELT